MQLPHHSQSTHSSTCFYDFSCSGQSARGVMAQRPVRARWKLAEQDGLTTLAHPIGAERGASHRSQKSTFLQNRPNTLVRTTLPPSSMTNILVADYSMFSPAFILLHSDRCDLDHLASRSPGTEQSQRSVAMAAKAVQDLLPLKQLAPLYLVWQYLQTGVYMVYMLYRFRGNIQTHSPAIVRLHCVDEWQLY